VLEQQARGEIMHTRVGRARILHQPIALAVAAMVAVGCSGADKMLSKAPAISDSGQAERGKVVWHDLVTHDLATAKRFYAATFGWTFEDVTSGYAVARNNGRLVAGIGRIDNTASGSQWIAQISVDDIDGRAAAVKKKGGKVLLGPFDLRGRGRVAVLSDPQSAVFGLIDSASGDPLDRKAELNDWLWHEVWVDDPAAATAFYRELIGYSPKTKQIGDTAYSYLATDETPRIGVVAKPDPKIGSAWASYIRVADVSAVAARVEQNGGTVLFAPQKSVRQGTVAVVADPGGAAFLLQQWPLS
jgi:predicted enzyme related to lactoylglutathione lyase